MKSGFCTTTSDDQLSDWTKRKLQSISQSQTCTKKGHGHCLVVWWPSTACWMPVKPLHLSSMLSKSVRYTENCNAWSWHWSTEKGPILFHDNALLHITQSTLQKLNELGYEASATMFTLALANRLLLLQASQQLFAGKTFPQSAGGRKCFPRVCQILKHGFLCYRNKQTYFSLTKMCWL